MDRIKDDVEQMIASGDIDGAIRYSGEVLAEADSALSRGRCNPELLERYLGCAFLHLATLRAAGNLVEVASCGMMVMCTADICKGTSMEHLSCHLADIMASVLESIITSVQQMEPTPERIEHIQPLLLETGALLQHYLDVPDATCEEYSRAAAGRNLLAFLTESAGSLPQPTVDGVVVDLSHPKALLADILGHMSAVGLLEV